MCFKYHLWLILTFNIVCHVRETKLRSISLQCQKCDEEIKKYFAGKKPSTGIRRTVAAAMMVCGSVQNSVTLIVFNKTEIMIKNVQHACLSFRT